MRAHLLKIAPLVALTLLASCVAHDKQGDKYAAVGDWKNAYANYRQALANKPQDPVLKQKFENARERALQDASAAANGCASQGQWECALQESDFVLSVDASRSEIASVRQRAATEVALSRLGQVQAEVVAGRLQVAAGLIQQARQLSTDPSVENEARRATEIYSSGVVDESEKLREARRYPEAIALLQAGANLDPGLRSRLDAAVREYESWKAAEHDRFMAEGDGHLSAGRWAEAQSSFRSAQQMRPDDRGRLLEQYARFMLAGDEAVNRSDWNGATQIGRASCRERVDRGFAEEQAARVTVRPWAVNLKTVVITPLRPNRTPWVGESSRRLDRIQEILAGGWRDPLAGRVLLALNDIPPVNRPDLVIEVTLPDGTRLHSRPGRAIYAAPRAAFVVASNGFDRRKVAFRVFHRLPGGATEEIGYADATLGELVSRRMLVLQDRSVCALELTVDPADGSREGAYTGLTMVSAPVAARPAPPPPPATRTSPPPRPRR